jgi:hypothetical protein
MNKIKREREGRRGRLKEEQEREIDRIDYVGFEVLTAVVMKCTIF